MSETPKEIKNLEKMTGSNAKKLGRYGENHHEEAWLVPEKDSASIEIVYGGSLGYNNFLDGDNAVTLASQFSEPAVIVLKHANPCGMATHTEGNDLIFDLAVALNGYSPNGQAFLRVWAGDTMSAMGSVIASTKPLNLEIAKLVNNRTIDVLFVPDVEGAAIDELKAHDEKRLAKDPKYNRTLKVVVTDSINRQIPEFYAERSTRWGMLVDKKTPRISLADDISDLFKPAELMHCNNSGKDLMVGVMTEKAPSPDRAGLYAFGITAAKGTKSNAIVIVREYAPGCYQVLGMGAGQPNRKDAAMLAGRKATENLKREYFRIEGKNMLRKNQTIAKYIEDSGTTLKRWENVKSWMRSKYPTGNDQMRCFIEDYHEREQSYVKAILGNDNVIVTSDAFFPKPDGLDELLDTGVKNVISPGGSKQDAAVIARANERGASLIHTGVRYFLH